MDGRRVQGSRGHLTKGCRGPRRVGPGREARQRSGAGEGMTSGVRPSAEGGGDAGEPGVGGASDARGPVAGGWERASARWARGVRDGPRGESDRAGPRGRERRGKMAWASSSLGWGKGKGRRPGWAARGKRKLGSAGLLGWIHFFFFFLYFLFLFLTQTQAK